jgi:squalene cyclase
MMDKHKANTGEIAAIKLVYPNVTKCRRTALDKIWVVLPSVSVIVTDEIRNIDAKLIELIEQKISWGEYITGSREEAVAASTLITAETEKIESGLERSHEAELGRRQAAANALMQYSQTQQMINAMNRPHVDTATCTAMGNTVNCMGVSQ